MPPGADFYQLLGVAREVETPIGRGLLAGQDDGARIDYTAGGLTVSWKNVAPAGPLRAWVNQSPG